MKTLAARVETRSQGMVVTHIPIDVLADAARDRVVVVLLGDAVVDLDRRVPCLVYPVLVADLDEGLADRIAGAASLLRRLLTEGDGHAGLADPFVAVPAPVARTVGVGLTRLRRDATVELAVPPIAVR